jgi:hypothetical protein
MARKILQLVAVLHHRGYERLRISPYMSASGLYWRCDIGSAHYSSADMNCYFGWPDAKENTSPEKLAYLFIERFSETAQASFGKDVEYVLWYAEMLRVTEPSNFPIAFADYPTPDDCWMTVGEKQGLTVPLPPPLL